MKNGVILFTQVFKIANPASSKLAYSGGKINPPPLAYGYLAMQRTGNPWRWELLPAERMFELLKSKS